MPLYRDHPAGDTVSMTDGFEITALANIPDLHIAIFGLDATG